MGLQRTIERSLAAQATGRIPGKPGRPISTLGSKCGHNGSQVTSNATALCATRRRKHASTKPVLTQKLTTFELDNKPTSCDLVYKRPAAMQGLALLEVCAYPGSSLSRAFAQRGQAAVRIAHRKQKDTEAEPGPDPVILDQRRCDVGHSCSISLIHRISVWAAESGDWTRSHLVFGPEHCARSEDSQRVHHREATT